MHLLIEHGTWVIVPIGLMLGLIYLHVYPKVYPLLLARYLDHADGRQSSSPVRTQKRAPSAGPATFKTRAAVKSRP